MKRLGTVLCSIALSCGPAIAEEKRDLESHKHGVAHLNVAVEGKTVLMEFEAPGADIVGFEHAASSDEDREKVTSAITALENPASLVEIPAKANCTVREAEAELHAGSGHSDVDGHAEFHAKYTLSCENIQAINAMTFSYFDTFKNAREIEVQIVTESGAGKFDVLRDQPSINLAGML